jgi:heat shock protein HslJ
MNARIWIASFWLMTLVGCAGLGGDDSKPVLITSSNVNRLFDKGWELKQLTLDNSRVIMHVDAQMTLAFAPGGQAAGFASVNQFGGPYVFSETGALSWPKGFTTTRKAGAPELMDKERAYLAALPKTTRAVLQKNALLLQNEDGSTVLQFLELGK